MTTRIGVIEDGDSVFVRCEACGLTCPVPPDMPPAPLDVFVRQHQLEVDPALHPVECPAWGQPADSDA